MTKKIYYEKVGRRYRPVAEYDQELLDSFPKGNHLIMCYPGGQSRRYNIDPNHAAMIAAGRVAEDAIRSAIHRASEAKPVRTPLTKAQQRAWQAMKKAFGDDRFHITYGSVVDAVDAGMQAMQAEAAILMSNPAVQHAYEQFMLVCKLTKQQES